MLNDIELGHTAVVHPGSDGIMAANQERDRLAAAAALAVAASCATLATLHEGVPHASLVTPAWDVDGQPILLLSALAAHTRHLAADPACALLVLGSTPAPNPQTTPRLSLNGIAIIVPAALAQERYLKTHPYAETYAGFGDFGYWKINVTATQYIGGFAAACHLDVAALQHEISALLRAG
jgi:putative heme iron utilization protein